MASEARLTQLLLSFELRTVSMQAQQFLEIKERVLRSRTRPVRENRSAHSTLE